jgi:sarcosine oxidase subunit beta
MSAIFDCAVIGAGVMGCSTALFLARGGMKVVLLDRGAVCRQASGVNAGTLTLQMTRAALVPYAMRAFDMWMTTPSWLAGGDVRARTRPGLSVAFTDAEAEMLEQRARIRGEAGAPITLMSGVQAQAIEPGLSPDVKLAGHCPVDGFASSHLTGRAFLAGLRGAVVDVREHTPVSAIDRKAGCWRLATPSGPVLARRVVLAGGVWLGDLAAMLGVRLRIRTLINQLIVTAPMAPVMRSVLGIASGLLSLKQYENGSVLVGGGWQGAGDRHGGALTVKLDNMLGNLRLAAHAIPALRESLVLRAWLGLEAETDDALPAIGPLPRVKDAWMIGSVHSGYTSGPFMGRILAQAMLGETPDLPLFPIDRLVLA